MISLTSIQKAILDAIDTALDSAFTGGVENPDTSSNSLALQGYDTLPTSGQNNLDKLSVRGVFRAVWAAVMSGTEAWNEVQGGVGFENSTSNTGGAWETVGFYRDPFGTVHLKGRCGGVSAVLTTMFTLPAGYRPRSGKALSFAITANSLHGELRINDSGQVFVNTGTALTNISLDGVSFRAEA